MGNIIQPLFAGFAHVAQNLFHSPLDFLSGKSCSSVCGTTWDFICYIENFCIANLLKLATVAVLFYFVLLFFYLVYKLGICQCVGRALCRMVWACFATWFSAWEYCCYFLCHKLRGLKRIHRRRKRDIEMMDKRIHRRHKRDIEMMDKRIHRRHKRDIEMMDTSTSDEDQRFYHHLPGHNGDRRSVSHRWRDYKRDHLRRSLRAKSHRIRVGISEDSAYVKKRNPVCASAVHDIRVTRTSKFAQKGVNYIHRRRR